MTFKELINLALVVLSLPTFTALLMYSRKARDVAFFVMVFGTMIVVDIDANFMDRIWYRGTTRGFEISLIDILSIALLVVMLVRPKKGEPRLFWPASLAPMLIYFGYCILSVMFSDPKLWGMYELAKIARAILVTVAAANYIRGEKQLRVFIWAVICAVIYQGLYALNMRYRIGIHRVYGTLEHPNSLSLYMCMALPVLYAVAMSKLPKWPRWLALIGVVLAMAGVILTISRTGVVTLGLVLIGIVAACFTLKLNLRNIVITGGVAVALVFGVAYSWKTLMSRFEGASYADEKEKGRGEYIRLAKLIVAEEFFGVGLGNWSFWVSNKYGPMDGSPFVPYIDTIEMPPQENPRGLETAQAPPAHNLGALTVGELGWPGLIIFTAIWLRWFQMGFLFVWKRRSEPMMRIGAGLFFAVCAAFFQSLTEWEYRQGQILFTIHIYVGVLAGLYWRYQHPEKKREQTEPERTRGTEHSPEFQPQPI